MRLAAIRYLVESTNVSGYSEFSGFDSSAAQVFALGYGNSSSSAPYAGKDYFFIGTHDFEIVNNSNVATAIFTQGGNVGIGTTTPSAALQVVGDIKYSGLLTDTSDRQLKDNIRLLGPQLGKITSLQPVSFTMKADKEHRTEFGLIAQDAEPIYPDLVVTAPDGTKSLAYTGLIAPLIEAAKEQQAEINQIRAMLALVFCAALLPTFLLWRTRRM